MIYLDMDGVIANFVGAAIRTHKLPTTMAKCGWDFWTEHGVSNEDFWKPFTCSNWWAALEPLADGMRLYQMLKIDMEPITILSNGGCPGSVDGKREWLRSRIPELAPGAAFCAEKWRLAHAEATLIDDHEPNIDAFIQAGGKGLLIPRPWNRLAGECDQAGNFDSVQVYCEFLQGTK